MKPSAYWHASAKPFSSCTFRLQYTCIYYKPINIS